MLLVDVMQGWGLGFCATGVSALVVLVSTDADGCVNAGGGHVWCGGGCSGA